MATGHPMGDRQTLARKVVADRQDLEFGSALGRIEDKVQGPRSRKREPDLLRALGLNLGLGRPGRLALWALAPAYQQALLTPQTLHPFVVDRLAFVSQPDIGLAEAPTRVFLGEGAQLLAQRGVSVGPGPVLERSSM